MIMTSNTLLFGHSFVKRVAPSGSLEVEVKGRKEVVRCQGERGLTLRRLNKSPWYYVSRIRSCRPSTIILDLGTNDLGDDTPEEINQLLWRFVDLLLSASATIVRVFVLPVLPRVRQHRKDILPLGELNRRVVRLNALLLAEALRRDWVWVWEHRSLRHSCYSLDGVHLTPRGMEHYVHTVAAILHFVRGRFWD